MSVFRSYDVRGKYPAEINEELAYKIGRALVKFLGAKKIITGYDARDSSPSLHEALCKGAMDQGADVVDAGMISTPFLYYLAMKDEFDGSVTVTASHNPKGYNGFKMCGNGGKSLGLDSGLAEIRDIVEENDFEDAETKGEMTERNYTEEYIDFLANFAKGDMSHLNIVVDASNGSAGVFIQKLLDRLKINYKGLNMEPDENFPNHPPNPLLPESQVQVKEELNKGDYDFGAVLDADGDRIIFFDNKGKMLKASTILGLQCRYYYEDVKGRNVVMDVLTYRRGVRKLIEKTGVSIIPTPVGYINIKRGMSENEGMAAAEYSGHFSNAETNNSDNSLLAMIKLISAIAKSGMKITEAAADLEGLYLAQVNFEVEDKDEKIKKVDEEFSDAGETLKIDGVSKTYPDYWFNVRKSNTEPLVRVTIETEDEDKFEEVLQKIKVVIGAKGEGERYAG